MKKMIKVLILTQEDKDLNEAERITILIPIPIRAAQTDVGVLEAAMDGKAGAGDREDNVIVDDKAHDHGKVVDTDRAENVENSVKILFEE